MMEKIISEVIKERCYRYTHSSGLTVYLCPMEKYSSACAQFTVRFGSIDNNYRLAGGEYTDIPDGTAHYLEHKLFESPEKNVFSLFAENGADCNAGTSFDHTSYYFSCTDNFRKNLETLLDFVQQPYFTPENVEKERGIITQEITMYRDSPDWRVFMELLQAIYAENPIRNDIAGSPESISHITDTMLYDIYNVFYNPSNMALSIAGNFSPEEAAEICGDKLKGKAPVTFDIRRFSEPYGVIKKKTEIKMPVGKPQFMIGFKLAAKKGADAIEDYVYFLLIFDMIYGGSSEFYLRMRNSGVLNESFYFSIYSGRNFIIPTVNGETDDPDAVFEEIKKEFRRFKKELPSKEKFNVSKKYYFGSNLRGYNNVSTMASSLTYAAMNGHPPYCIAEMTARADYDKMCERLTGFDEENAALSVIYPM